MATLDEVRGAIHTLLAAELTSIRFAPEHPPETLGVFPAMVVYVQGGTWSMETGAMGKLGLARVVVEIHVQREQGLNRALDELHPYLDSVPNALIAGLRDGDYSQRFTFGLIEYEIAASEWSGVKTQAVRFTVNDVKVRNDVP